MSGRVVTFVLVVTFAIVVLATTATTLARSQDRALLGGLDSEARGDLQSWGSHGA